jgi:ABC-type Zn uptake system ZnuABC Zn-binding protein ZnuA
MRSLPRLFAFFLLACALPLRAEGPLKVSSFSTILTEIAARVGGDLVQVHAHVKPGSDPHDFEPKPSDLKRVAEADVVLLSAKHMEGYVGKLQEASGGRAKFLEVGSQLPSLWLRSQGADGKSTKEEDPHWWHSVENTQRAAKVVRDALVTLLPQQREAFQRNTAAYLAELGELQKWARQRVTELPRDKRKLVTSHDALQYFAKEYGFTVYPVEGLTPSEQPASRQVAELLTTLKSQRVKAVFSEDTVNPKVLKQITAETGAVLGGQLWVDGLGTGEASTYPGMFKHNVNTIVEALK